MQQLTFVLRGSVITKELDPYSAQQLFSPGPIFECLNEAPVAVGLLLNTWFLQASWFAKVPTYSSLQSFKKPVGQ